MKIYVARHGQTAWNALNKTCGTTDLPLNELGLQQAEELADKVENLGIDLIIASTLIRAQQTAEAVSRRIGVPVITDPRIVEQNYGIYEGKDRKDPGFLENKRHFAYCYPGGGESMMDVAYRIFGFLKDIKEKYPIVPIGSNYIETACCSKSKDCIGRIIGAKCGCSPIQ